MEGQSKLLQWTSHQGAILSVFNTLLSTGSHVDVTIASEGQYIRAHKVILSACSPYFQELLNLDVNKHPILFLKDVKYTELQALIQYMYRGEVRVPQEDLPSLLKVAQGLKICGLAEETNIINGVPTGRIVEPSLLPPSIPTENFISQSSLFEPWTMGEGGPSGEQGIQAETGEEISHLFYTELLQNSQMHELLAERITECLDSRNSGAGDEVVKAVSSSAEKEILDAFFKDFFDVELGGMEVEVEEATTNSTLTDLNLPLQVEGGGIGDEPSAVPDLPGTGSPKVTAVELGTTCSGQVERPNVIVEPTPSTSRNQSPPPANQSSSSPRSSPKSIKLTNKTVITVTADDYRKAKNAPVPPIPSTRRKSGNYWKPRLLAPPSDEVIRGVPAVSGRSPGTTARLDAWTRLGRRSINPKIPNENKVASEVVVTFTPPSPVTTEVVTLTSPVKSPPTQVVKGVATSPSRPLSPPAKNELVTPTPVPMGSDLLVTTGERHSPFPNTSNSPLRTVDLSVLSASPLLRKSPKGQGSQVPITVESSSCEKIEKLRNPPGSREKAKIGKRNALCLALKRNAEKLMESKFPSPFTSLEKPSTWTNPHFLERKSLSTPRKRNRHVRNLHFKTPPSLRVESPGGLNHENFFNQKEGEGTSKEMKSKKKLEWTVTRAPLEKILEQEEQESFSGNGMKVDPDPIPSSCPLPDPSTLSGWVPPLTPRILSPQQCNSTWQSPMISQKVSPDHNYFFRLGQLLGSPLPAGTVPMTPGRGIPGLPVQTGSEGKLGSSLVPPPTSTLQIRRSPIASQGAATDKPKEATVIVEPPKGEEHQFRIPSKPRTKLGDPDSGKPPKKRRRVSDKNEFQNMGIQIEIRVESPKKKSPPVPSGENSEGSSRVLRPRLTSVPETPRIIMHSPVCPKLVAPTPPPVSPGMKRRVLALQKRTITFPERGFQFRTVLDRRPVISFKVNGRQRYISVSGKQTVLSLRNSPPLSSMAIPPEPSQSKGSNLTQLLANGPEVDTSSQNQVEMRTYNKRGQLVKMSSPSTYTFEEHFNVLLRRISSAPSSVFPVERETTTKP